MGLWHSLISLVSGSVSPWTNKRTNHKSQNHHKTNREFHHNLRRRQLRPCTSTFDRETAESTLLMNTTTLTVDRVNVKHPRKEIQKEILEEEEYVERLEKIIERDFYPDLQLLKQKQRGSSEDRGWPQGSPSSSWETRTPDRCQKEVKEVVAADRQTLNQFVATHTSEDNADFQKLLEQDQEKHRQKYHWAYNDQVPCEYYAPDGSRISKERKALMDQACADQGQLVPDHRSNVLQSWPLSKARNELMFMPPGINDLSSSSSLSLKRKKGTKERRAVVYSNTRFISSSAASSSSGPSQELAPPQSQVEYSYLQMTPALSPDHLGISPLMTWGELEATPMILNNSRDEYRKTTAVEKCPGSTPGRFSIPPTPGREELARELTGKTTTTPLSITHASRGRNKKGKKVSSVSRRSTTARSHSIFHDLTPAAQSMAKKVLRHTPGSSFRSSSSSLLPFHSSSRSSSRSSSQRTTYEDRTNTPRVKKSKLNTDGLLQL